MKRYRIPILYDCDDLPKCNSADVYEAEVVDKRIKRLEEKNLVLEIEVKDLKKEISGLNERYIESLKEKDAVQDAFDAQQDKIDHLEKTLRLKGLWVNITTG